MRARRIRKARPIWWAVHFILVMEHIKRKKSGPRYLVYENVYLVRARTGTEAHRKGEVIARQEVIPDDSLRWNGSPARWVYGGIRKVISCAENTRRPSDGAGGDVHALQDGDEATYSAFTVSDRASLRRLVRGDSATVVYEEWARLDRGESEGLGRGARVILRFPRG